MLARFTPVVALPADKLTAPLRTLKPTSTLGTAPPSALRSSTSRGDADAWLSTTTC